MKRALVTGASGAIGAAICRRLAQEDLHVIVHANTSLQDAAKLTEDILKTGGSAESIAFDVTDSDATGAALTSLLDVGPVQVLINNAGIHEDAPMAGMRQAQWRNVLDVSLDGFFNVTQPLLLPMMRTRWGRIVNLSSISAITGNRGQANYAAAKAGLHGATRSLSKELASRGVTVNAVAPGIIESPMTAAHFDAATIKTLVPMKRAGTTEEVAELVGFLTSDKAAYITGQVISINGGMI